MIDSGVVDQTIGNEDGTSLTKESTTRRDESGRFAAPSEQSFGLEGVEADQGYTQLPAAEDVALEEVPTFDEFKAAIADEAPLEFEKVKWEKADGTPLADNVTVTADQAGSALAACEGEVSSYIEGTDLAELAGITDPARAEALKASPEHAEEFGIDPAQVKANAEALQGEQKEATADVRASPPVEPDAEFERLLNNPHAVEAWRGRFVELEQHYANGLNAAYGLAQQSVIDDIPELRGVPPDQWQPALMALAQQDPQRIQGALNKLARFNQTQAAQAQWQQHQAAQLQQRQLQQFESHVNAEDARLVEMVGGQKAADEANQAMIDYLTSQGVARNQQLNVFMQNPVLRTAEARQIAWKAQQYDRLMAAPKAVPTRTLPHVQKPGSSNSMSRSEISLAALEARFNKNLSIDDAFALYQARQRA
jgi:hypothetical protein